MFLFEGVAYDLLAAAVGAVIGIGVAYVMVLIMASAFAGTSTFHVTYSVTPRTDRRRLRDGGAAEQYAERVDDINTTCGYGQSGRVRTVWPFVTLLAIREIRCLAFLHPVDDRCDRVVAIGSDAAAAVRHAGHHEQADEVGRVLPVLPAATDSWSRTPCSS